MNTALVVAAREFEARRSVLLAAVVFGLFPFFTPFFWWADLEPTVQVRDILARLLAVGMGIAWALLTGATVVNRDLAEGRLGFDFARPLPALAIWGGRFAAALALTVSAIVLSLLPTALVGGGLLSVPLDDLVTPAATIPLVLLLLIIPLAHALGLAVRSRSRWLAVDLACSAIVFVLVAQAARRLYDSFAFGLLADCGWVLAGVLIAALWVASAVQVAVGRADLERGHRALSLCLWSVLLAAALAGQAYTLWVVRARPADLVEAVEHRAPGGGWAFVAGRTAWRGDFHAAFLVDGATGRFLRLPGQIPGHDRGVLSADRRHAAWLRVEGPRNPSTEVFVADLGEPSPQGRPTRILFPDPWVELTLSADGGSLAAVHRDTLAIYDVDTGRSLAAVRLPAAAGKPWHMAFADPGHVRLWRTRGSEREILELDVARRVIREVG